MQDILIGIEHVVKNNATTGLTHADGQRLWLRLRFENLSLSVCARGLISSRKFPHKSVPAVVIKIDASDVGVVQSAGTSPLVVITGTGTIKVGGRSTTTTSARESRPLILLVLALESLQEIGSGFRGELIVSKSDADRSTGKIESVHLLQSLTGLAGISESRMESVMRLGERGRSVCLLHESIATAASCVVLLELNELEFAEWLEDILKILLSDAEVNIANVQTVERDRVGVATGAARLADLSILLSFGKLDDNRNT